MFEIRSIGDAVDSGDAGHELALPFDTYRPIHVRVPEEESAQVETVAALGYQDDVDNVLEVFVGGRQLFDDLVDGLSTCLLMVSMNSWLLRES